MSMIHEFRFNSSRFVNATALFDQCRNVYREQGFAQSYEVAYNLFEGLDIPIGTIESMLAGTTEIPIAFLKSGAIEIFLTDEEMNYEPE